MVFSSLLLAVLAMNPTPPMGDGIYSHQIYSASSRDAKSWTPDGKLLFDHASVPDAVIDRQGRIYLYFMDATDRGHKMSVAISGDLGKSWKKETVVIAKRQSPGMAVDPNPIMMEDGSIRLFYLGTFGPPRPDDPDHQICSALSQDGIHFTEEPGIRFSAPRLTDPDVIRTPTGWKMFVSQGRINLSTSSVDGKTFTQDASPASTRGAVSRTIAVNGGYRMFRCDRGIAMQFTKDFKIWQEEGPAIVNRLGEMVCDPGIIQLPDGSWKMYYKKMPLPPPPIDQPN